MKEQSLVHVRLDYEEAIQSKKDLLSSERDFIRMIKIMKRYNLLRRAELNTKIKMQNKVKSLKTNLGRLSEIFPKIKIPSILKRDNFEEKPLRIKKESKNGDLESQLKEIQERLRKLG